jgi:L-ascorbate metabolism protein UlaG (beta-lactamase superfamily)
MRAVLFVLAVFASSWVQTPGPEIDYVANSGMLVTTSGRRFLIDAPIRDGLSPYPTSSADERARLEGATAPYDNIDAILITHWHEDHFSPEAVAAHLMANPRTLFISSPQVAEKLAAVAPAVSASRFRTVLPAPGRAHRVDVRGVSVHVLRIRHNPARRFPEQHVGFLIGGAAPVLHTGDADPAADNFIALETLPAVDVALLPFWYVSDAANRRFVADTIRPRRIVAMHATPEDAAKVEATLRTASIPVVVAAKPGSRLVLPAPAQRAR